jgi:hypothetical protein
MVSPALNAALVSAWSKCPRCYTAHADRPAQQKIMLGVRDPGDPRIGPISAAAKIEFHH